MKIFRDKLPRGWGYPLKASALEHVIEEVGLRAPVELFLHHSAFWTRRPLFHASFHPDGTSLNDDEIFRVGCRAVAAADCGEVRSFIEGDGLPFFGTWAANLEALDHNSTIRLQKQEIVRDWAPINVR